MTLGISKTGPLTLETINRFFESAVVLEWVPQCDFCFWLAGLFCYAVLFFCLTIFSFSQSKGSSFVTAHETMRGHNDGGLERPRRPQPSRSSCKAAANISLSLSSCVCVHAVLTVFFSFRLDRGRSARTQFDSSLLKS